MGVCIGLCFLTACTNTPNDPSTSLASPTTIITVQPDSAWLQQITSAKNAASEADKEAVLYDILMYSPNDREVTNDGKLGRLESDFHFVGPSGVLVRVLFLDDSPTTKPQVLQEKATSSPYDLPYKQYYANTIEDAKISPRETAAIAWQHLPTSLQEAGVYPVIYINLDQLPLTWYIEYVAPDDESLNKRTPAPDSPTMMISSSYAYAFNIDAKTGDIISQDPDK